MFRRTVTLFVALLGIGYAGSVSAQQGNDWKVRAGEQQKRKIVARYTKVLIKHPERTFLVRRLVEKVGRGKGLDALIERIKTVADEQPERSEPQVLLGHLLTERGRITDAMKAYREAVEAEPDDPDARSALGLALIEAGRPDRARVQFEKALELQKSHRDRRELLRRLADLAIGADRPDEAVEWFERLVQERPRDDELRIEFAELLSRARRFGQATEEYEKALELVGGNGKRRASILRDLGSLHRRMHDPVAAADHYRRALRLTARGNWMRRELWTRLVDVHREMHRLPDIYAELTEEWPRPGYAESMQLASLADEIGRGEDATEWLERAARLDRRALEPRTRLIARLEMSGDHERVRELYDEILRLRPDDVVHRMELAEWIFFRRQKPDRAMKLLRKAEARWKNDPDSLVEIARSWHRFGVPDQALRIHRTIAESWPLHVGNLEVWGELRARLGDVDRAIEIWGRLRESDLTEVRARLRLADLLLRVDQAERAIDHLEYVVGEHPDVPDLRQRLAATYERARKWDEAMDQWETLFFEHSADHAAGRVVAIVDRTYDEDTLDRWEKRWEADGSLRVGIVVARMRRTLRQRDPGPVEIAVKIARKDPDELEGAERLAWAEAVEILVDHRASHDPAAAIRWLRALGETFSERRVLTARTIADIAFTMDPPEAMEHIEYVVKVAPNDPYVRSQVGNFFGTNGQGDLAIHHLARAIELGPSGFEPYFDLVHYLTEAERDEEAREVLLKVVVRDRAGKAAVSAALAALDLCRSDADVIALEERVRELRGRIPSEEFRTIMAGVYQYLFVYADDPESAFHRLAEEAFPIIVDAVQSSQLDVRTRAASLARLYDERAVVRRAEESWSEEWNAEMAWVLTRADESNKAMLADALESTDETVRLVAMLGLARTAGRESLDALDAALREDQPEHSRAMAAMVLGGIEGEDVIARLGALAADDPHEEVRVAATWALGRTGAPEAAELLRARLGDGDERVANTASWALASLRNDAGIRALFEAYWGSSPSARRVAERGLRLQPAEIVQWWSPAKSTLELPDPATLVRKTLEEATVSTADAPIARSFHDHSAAIAGVAGEHLDRDDARERVLDDLVKIADEAPDEDRGAVAAFVGALRPRLRKLAVAEQPAVVHSAALLLPHAGNPDDIDVVVSASAKLRSTKGAEVLERLSQYPWDSVRDPLVDAAKSRSGERRRASLRAIARSDPAAHDPEVVEIVVRAAREAPTDIKLVAIETLGALGHDASTDMLVGMFEEADYRTRVAILGSLESMGTERAETAAKQLLIVPTKRPCRGDPDDLEDLLDDACTGVFDVPDF